MATSTDNPLLAKLLVRRDELRREGRDPTAEELCADRPELTGELRARIEALNGSNPAFDTGGTAIFDTPSPSCSAHSADRPVPGVMHALAVYWPQRHHARGGLGEVLVARQEELGRLVALKRIRPERLQGGARNRFLREAEITAGLQHPGIVPIYGLGHDDQGPFYTMPLIDGQTLQEVIQKFHGDESLSRNSGQGSLRFRELLQKFTVVCDTVAYAHDKGVIHRDLKPANIMLGRYGETQVMDWGLAKRFGTPDPDDERESEAQGRNDSTHGMTGVGAIMGTPQYMSPEQAKGEPTGPASDTFNLGLILYAILTGCPAFAEVETSETDPLEAVRDAAVIPLHQRNPDLPPALEAICLKALAARPEDRYASVRDLARDLEKWLADEPVSVYRRRWGERLSVWARRHRAWVFAGTVALLLVTIVSIAALLGMDFERRKATESALAEAAARQQSVASEIQARAALHQSKKSAAMLTVDTGLHLCEEGEVSHGILSLARGLRELPDGESDLQHIIRSNLAAWSREAHRLRFSVEHAGALNIDRIAFSADGQSFMTAGGDEARTRGEIRTWNVATGEPNGRVMSYPTRLWAMAADTDGKTILSGPGNDVTLTRETSGGPERSAGRVFKHQSPVLAAVLSRDGKFVLTGCADGSARVWDAQSGVLRGPVITVPQSVVAVALSPDNKMALTGSIEGIARLWDVSTGKSIGVPMDHRLEVFAVAFSPNGKTIVTVSRDGAARLWDAVTCRTTGVVLRHPYSIRSTDSSMQPASDMRNQSSAIKAIAFSPDGKVVLTGSIDATARLWDVVSGKVIGEPLVHEDEVDVVAFSPDGETILTSTRWKTHAWDLTGIRHTRLKFQHSLPVAAVAFSPDGRTILAGCADLNPLNFIGPKGQAQLWNIATGTAIGDPIPHKLAIVSVAFSPDGTRFLTGGARILRGPGEARLWRTATREPIGKVLAYDEPIYVVAFDPTGRTFLTAGGSKIVQLFDVETAKLLRTIPNPDNVLSAVFSPDGRMLLTGDNKGIARMWNVATERPVGGPLAVFGREGKASFESDESSLIQGGQTGTYLRSSIVSGRVVMGVAFSPDGSLFLTGGGGQSFGEARLWMTSTGSPTGKVFRHQLMVRPVAFSPDGKSVLTGGGDKTARLWDLATGRPIGAALNHDDWVTAAAFSPGGKFILTGSRDKTARLWATPSPLKGAVERISLWAEVITGMDLDDDGAVRVLDGAAWRKRRLRLQELGGPPGSL